MTDIVERLRKRHDFGCRFMDAPHTHECDCSYVDRHEAADEIERLRAECLRLSYAEAETMLEEQVKRLRAAERDRLRELLRLASERGDVADADNAKLRAEVAFHQSAAVQFREERDRLRAALRSIAANTCCDKCQEAALVAKAALEEGS